VPWNRPWPLQFPDHEPHHHVCRIFLNVQLESALSGFHVIYRRGLMNEMIWKEVVVVQLNAIEEIHKE
jgi:hypothetical protein